MRVEKISKIRNVGTFALEMSRRAILTLNCCSLLITTRFCYMLRPLIESQLTVFFTRPTEQLNTYSIKQLPQNVMRAPGSNLMEQLQWVEKTQKRCIIIKDR